MFAENGFAATRTEDVVQRAGLTRGALYHHFRDKEDLFRAVHDEVADEVVQLLWRRSSEPPIGAWALFRANSEVYLDAVTLGTPAATRFVSAVEPLVQRATGFLEAEMDAGHLRRHEPRLLLLAIYSTVIGMVTEVEVLRALGEEPTARSLVRRRADVLLPV